MATSLVPAAPAIAPETIEKVLLQGDLSSLKPAERLSYYNAVCQSLNLNPLTRPFDYITFKGRTVLYAKRECTEQLRRMYGVSVSIKSREITEGCYVVTASASLPDGRTDECIGAITLDNLKGEDRANALMKAETKAKRRVTLAICGMAFLDESEIGADNGGSKQAQQDVLDRKLREINDRKAIAAAAEAVPAEPIDEPEPSELEQQLAESIKQAQERNAEKRDQKLSKFDVLRDFAEQKKRYEAIGMPDGYYAALGEFGVEHSNEFKLMKQALACLQQMKLNVSDLETYVAQRKTQ